MSTRKPAANGGEDQGDGEHSHAVDWFAILDVAVWAAVVIVVVVGLDMLFGRIVRDRIASGASRYLAKVNAGDEAA